MAEGKRSVLLHAVGDIALGDHPLSPDAARTARFGLGPRTSLSHTWHRVSAAGTSRSATSSVLCQSAGSGPWTTAQCRCEVSRPMSRR